MKFKNIILFLLSASIFSCEVGVTDTTYNITCNQPGNDSDSIFCTNLVGYGFYADTSLYEPLTFTQAVGGALSLRTSTSQEISYDIQASFVADQGLISFNNLTKDGKVIFVICDYDNEIYSYREFEVVPNLLEINTDLFFNVTAFTTAPDTTITTNSWIQRK